VKIHVEVVWIVTPYSVAVGYQSFGGPFCLHLHPLVSELRNCSPVIISLCYQTYLLQTKYDRVRLSMAMQRRQRNHWVILHKLHFVSTSCKNQWPVLVYDSRRGTMNHIPTTIKALSIYYQPSVSKRVLLTIALLRPVHSWDEWSEKWKSRHKKHADISFALNHAIKAYWGVKVWLHTFLTLTIDGGGWSASHPGCFTSRGRALVPTG